MADLSGKVVAISISDAPDRQRLGFPQNEVDRVLLAVCTGLVRSGARIMYGGNLDPAGYTFKIFRHLAGAYGTRREEPPFIHVLPSSVIEETPDEDLKASQNASLDIVETLGVQGDDLVHIDDVVRELRISQKPIDPAAALTEARIAMSKHSDARVIMGGKMGIEGNRSDHYSGKMPGILEEAILALEYECTLIVLGAFGGAARDAAIALGLLPEGERVPRGRQAESYYEAVVKLSSVAGMIDDSLRGALKEIAAEESAEALARKIGEVVQKWAHRPKPAMRYRP